MIPLEFSISWSKIKCGETHFNFKDNKNIPSRSQGVKIKYPSDELQTALHQTNQSNSIVIGVSIGSVIGITIATMVFRKYKTSTQNNSWPASINGLDSNTDPTEHSEPHGPFRCKRRANETSEEREDYKIFNSYKSMDSSWRLDRKNGDNWSLDESEVRKAKVDSRIHRDTISALGCCYEESQLINSGSQITDLTSSRDTNLQSNIKRYGSEPHVRTTCWFIWNRSEHSPGVSAHRGTWKQ